MKKTLIAAAVAASFAAPAFAEVKVSGVINQQFTKTDGTATAAASDNFVKFSASEDLGNGMTAFGALNLSSNAAAGTKDNIVGLKGSFGTVILGRFEDFTEGKLQSRMTLASETGAAGMLESNYNAGRTDGGMAYVTPTVNGFHAGIGAYTGATTASSGYDAVDMAVFYDNGPLSIAIARENFKGALGVEDEKNTTFTASYTMGDIKATVMRTDTDNESGTAANDSTDMAYRIDYTMGNNVITLGYKDDESVTGGKGNDVWAIVLDHKFSKATDLYVHYKDTDVAAGANGDQEYRVGLRHKF